MLEPNFSPFPTLATERLILREPTQTDAPEMFTLRSNPTLMQYIDMPLAKSIEDAQEFIQKMQDTLATNEGVAWTITLKENPKVIGFISYWCKQKEHYRAEIGYMLSGDFHRQGILHEAMQKVITYGFQVMGLHSIEANVNPENIASIGLLEKNNFVKEAHFRENYYFNGKFLDSAIYSLLNHF